MPIPLKIHEIRLEGHLFWPEYLLHTASPPMTRFYLILAQVKAIIEKAKQDPHTLQLITCPEGMISSLNSQLNATNKDEYDFMIKCFAALIQTTTNVLFMPGTIAYPDPKDLRSEPTFYNPAPIFYQDQVCEHYQRNEAPTHQVICNQSGEPVRLGDRIFNDIHLAQEPQKPIAFTFNNQDFNLFVEICAEHDAESLKKNKFKNIDNSLQVVLSNTIPGNKSACVGAMFVHTDILEERSEVYETKRSPFDLKEVKRYGVVNDMRNYLSDVSSLSPIVSPCMAHHSHEKTVSVVTELPLPEEKDARAAKADELIRRGKAQRRKN